MITKLLHTPEGVRDIYNDECRRKISIQTAISKVMDTYGYDPIETPSFEFFDVFSKEIGTVPSKDLYKFFDRDGNTLVLRPDITPSIARAVSKYYMDEDVSVRFRYEGHTFINHHSLRGQLKEVTQLGAENMGESGVLADAETLAMLTECLLASGLKDFQISVGHVNIINGLASAANFSAEDTDELKALLLNRNFLGVEEMAEARIKDDTLKKCFMMLGQLIHTTEELTEYAVLSQNYSEINESISYLLELNKLLEAYGIDGYVSYEPGIINEHEYYTGILFSAYTYGSGEPVASGGRYDKLLAFFGKNAPSIGFAITVDTLMAALERQNLTTNIDSDKEVIIYTEATIEQSIAKAKELRASGKRVLLKKEGEA